MHLLGKEFNPKHPYMRSLEYSINYPKQPHATNKGWYVESNVFGEAVLRSV